MYTIYINHLEKKETSNPLAYQYNDFSFWEKLIKWSIDRAVFYEIRLWQTDLEKINNLEMLGHIQTNNDTEEIVFVGKINELIEYKLLSKYLTDDNYIKYFTVMFMDKDNYIFSTISHYGEEVVLDVENEEEALLVKKSLENDFLSVHMVKSNYEK